MDFLDFIPSNTFETIGTIVGFVACATIAVQLLKEYRCKQPSTLALIYVAGWLCIFFFWMLYGIRFRAVALWLPNCFATILQLLLLLRVLNKRPPPAEPR